MATPLPSPYLFACFPLQEYFVNKDTGFPLAGGYVEFFSDEAFTVPKDVYQYSYAAGQWTPVNIGSTLVLSSVGTFQYNNADIIPFLFPYSGTIDNPGDLELYFIRVWSGNPSEQGSVLQFTRSGWPPNLAQDSGLEGYFQGSNNAISNPEFSIVNFVVDPATQSYALAAPFTNTEIAPGWKLTAAGAGSVEIKQVEISQEWQSNPSYALQITVPVTATGVKLVQRLNQSPRVFYGEYVSMALAAASLTSTSQPITVNYIPNSGSSYIIATGTTLDNNNFSIIAGVNDAAVAIDGTENATAPDTGYVDISIDIPTSSVIQISSLCLTSVPSSSALIPYISSTNAEQTNALFWYYKPELEYKPIPSYALGWDFPMNPFQAQGTAAVGPYNITGPGKSFYVADQTILFQNTTNTTTVSKDSNRTLKLAVSANPSSLALIQYLGANEAQELLNNPVCSEIRAKTSTGTIVGQINLYYTKDSSLPVLGTDSSANCYTLVSAVNTTSAAPTVGGGGNYGNWTAVERNNLGSAFFTLSSTMTTYGFSGWLSESSSSDIAQAKFFAIVVSFAQIPVGSSVEIEHISLQKGYIPTPPAALSFLQTLQGLKQYYEMSYNVGNPAGSTGAGAAGPVAAAQQVTINVGANTTNAITSTFSTAYATKRASPKITYYSPSSGAINTVYGVLNLNGTANQAGDITIGDGVPGTQFILNIGENQTTAEANTPVAFQTKAGSTNYQSSAYVAYHFTSDARFGIA